MTTAIGLDIGGTAVKAGRLTAEGSLEPADSIPTALERGVDEFCDRLAELARSLGPFDALGLGVPGVFEPRTRRLAENPNLPALVGFDLRVELGQRLGLDPEKIGLENDANIAALGEALRGAGMAGEDLFMVTLGTGVGGGFIHEGHIFRGSLGQGIEVGHVFVHAREHCDVRCECGRWGCLETFASATAAKRRARRAGLTEDLVQLSDLARQGPGPAQQLLLEIGRDLGRGLAQVLVLLDPPMFAIGGGFGAALDVLLPGIREGIAERDFAQRQPLIVPATLGADAGWVGAACLAQQLNT